jgi:tellurite resistance protein TerC
MRTPVSFWLLFNAFVLVMLVLDLGLFHRKSREVSIREALLWSLFWIALALTFNILIYHWQGKEKALEFLTGYLIEKALSVDNIFVFILIFSYFRIPSQYQHRVLFWGIIGALIMRIIFIFAGVALIEKFHFVMYIFGGLLLYTGYKMFNHKHLSMNPEQNALLRFFRRLVPVTTELHQHKFFIRQEGRIFSTPLLLVLLLIESTDLVFAVDSIPAILAVTQDHFIVYTSNVFAILGLRSLFFALAGIVHRFWLLNYGLAVVLVFVGLKMLLADWYKIPVEGSLIFISVVIALSVFLSLKIKKPD